MKRRTKIVCTLGPSSNDRKTIRALIEAGLDIARLNFSHGSHDDHRKTLALVREEARRAGRHIPILQDLQGPKIRVGVMKDGGVLIHKGQRLILTSQDVGEGTAERAHISYTALADDVQPGGRILMDDGLLELKVTEVQSNGDVYTEVVVGGPLRSRKGVNLPHIRTSRPSLTRKDLADLEFGLEHEVEYIALSFVRSEQDVDDLLQRIEASG